MEQKDNTIKLFKNKYKTEKKHPNFKGKAVVGGKKMDASGWLNTDKNGQKWINVTLEEPYNPVEYTESDSDASWGDDLPC